MEAHSHYFSLDPPVAEHATIGGVRVATSSTALVLREFAGSRTLPPPTYFPRAHVDFAALVPSDRRTRCPIKGECQYWDFVGADGTTIESAAWSYDRTIESAEAIRDYVAFDDRWSTLSPPVS